MDHSSLLFSYAFALSPEVLSRIKTNEQEAKFRTKVHKVPLKHVKITLVKNPFIIGTSPEKGYSQFCYLKLSDSSMSFVAGIDMKIRASLIYVLSHKYFSVS